MQATKSEEDFYQSLQRFVLSEQQLRNNGYPLTDPQNPGLAKIYPTYGPPPCTSKDDQRECNRCKKMFKVDASGKCVSSERCIYHSRRGMLRGGRMVHACCSGSTPCLSFKTHVFRVIDFTGFVKTEPHSEKVQCSADSESKSETTIETPDQPTEVSKITQKPVLTPESSATTEKPVQTTESSETTKKPVQTTECSEAEKSEQPSNKLASGSVTGVVSSNESKARFGVYSLDTERIWTTKGSEVASVTVIDMHLKPVYESLVRPGGEIIDYNTSFSGITEGQLDNVTKTLTDVQKELLELFSDKTILMGHSLESDLEALKIIHYTVVDTAIAFPHRRGPPLKRALRTLAEEFLGKMIQSQSSGHHSREDAVAVMELMLLKTGNRKRRYPFSGLD